MRYEPAGAAVALSADETLTREIADPFTRIDVWLRPIANAPDPHALLMIADDTQKIAAIPIDRSQLTAPYPTVLRLPERAVADRKLTVTLSGVGVEARLAADGQLALKTYHAIPIAQWLDRMTIVQPAFYTATFFRLLSSAYAISLIGFMVLLWRAASSPDKPSART